MPLYIIFWFRKRYTEAFLSPLKIRCDQQHDRTYENKKVSQIKNRKILYFYEDKVCDFSHGDPFGVVANSSSNDGDQ